MINRRGFFKALFAGAVTVAAKPLLKLLPKAEPFRAAVHPYNAFNTYSESGMLTHEMLQKAITYCENVPSFVPDVIYLPPASYALLQELTKSDLKRMYPEYKPEMNFDLALTEVRQSDYGAFKTTRDYFDIDLKPVKTTITLNKTAGEDFYI